MKIIFATHNEGKMREIRELLQDLSLPVYSAKEAGFIKEVEETGTTLEENAILKAKSLGQVEDAIVMGDDSGFFIEALNGEPGIYSARYIDSFSSREEALNAVIRRLSGLKDKERACYFATCVAVYFPDGTVRTTIGKLEGRVSEELRGTNGFGYDPIMYIPSLGKTTAEIPTEGKNAISHRSLALQQAKEFVREYLEKNS